MSDLPERSQFAHWKKIPTRWSDLDLLGHVNNSRFFGFDEDARLSYFEHLWKADANFWKDYGFILASLGCDFISQLHHPSELDVGFRVSKLGRSSIQTQCAMFHGERLVAVSRGVVVWFSYKDQKPLPVPDSVREMIRRREPLRPGE